MKNTKIGFVGAGFVAEFHIRALKSVRDVTVAGVLKRSGSGKLVKQINQSELGPAKEYDAIKAMCQEVDVVAVLAPNFAREQIHKEIADSGKSVNVVIEKPFARNVSEAERILAHVERGGGKVAYLENMVFMPPVVAARRQLAAVEEKQGPPYLARTAEEHGGPHSPWFWDPRQSGGGVWPDMGCHSVSVGLDLLTPAGKPPNFLEPVSVSAEMATLLWSRKARKTVLREKYGVDFDDAPFDDYAQATLRFRNPETGQVVTAQATDSWCYSGLGLRLLMEGLGDDYSLTVNTLNSSSGIFIGDGAKAAAADSETALEKSLASAGALVIQPDEPALYGYVDEWRNALACFNRGEDGFLNAKYGALIVQLLMAGYLSHEQGQRIDLTDAPTLEMLRTYVPKIQQGKGAEVL